MEYEITANRKRPQTLESLVGQEFIAATLKSSIEKGRIAHAYLFSGPRGVGKTSTARIFARSLNCSEGPSSQPCGVCPNCKEISKGNSLDVIEIDGASNTSVNDVRAIKDEVLFAPNSSRYKIYIIDEVHMLSNSAFNALLKTIEEPPPYIIFIFATTEIHKVPATIRSRCQQFNFRLISPELIKSCLVKVCNEMNLKYEEDSLLWIAKEATGSLRDAYTLLDQISSFSEGEITLSRIREKLGLVGIDQIGELVDLMADELHGDVLVKTDYILASGISIEQLIIELAEYFRDILFIKYGIKNESILGFSSAKISQKAVDKFSFSQLEFAIYKIHQLYRDIRYSINPRFELEMLFSKLSSLSRHITREGLLSQIMSLKQEILSGEIKVNPHILQEEIRQPASEEKKKTENDAELNDTAVKDIPHDAEEIKKILINTIRRENRSLTALLEKSEGWHYSEEGLFLFFKSEFDRKTVKDNIPFLKQVLFDTLKLETEIFVKTLSSEDKPEESIQNDNTEQTASIELVKNVFRGTIIQN